MEIYPRQVHSGGKESPRKTPEAQSLRNREEAGPLIVVIYFLAVH